MTLFALPAQAQITDVDNYTDLQNEAVLAAGDATIRLIDNITDGAAQLTIGRSLTLDLNGFDLTILLDDPTGQASNGIKLNAGVTLTIIDSSLPSTGTLTVTNGATADATAGNGAAINTTEGTLIIDSGTVTANGGRSGAGIGGGNGGNGGTITISGGEVIAKGVRWGAGIGGGFFGNGGTITISGGTVNANGGYSGAGIGGGRDGGSGTITVSGGTITANGGIWYSGGALGFGGGAGIGSGGTNSTAAMLIGSITITTTGTVTATGGAGGSTWRAGAAIGQGGYYNNDGAGIANVTTHPANPPAVTAGQTAAFAFAVTPVGTTPPAPAYQWEVSSGGAFANVPGGAGGTTANYTTAATTIAMNGNLYRNVAFFSNVNGDNSGTITYTSHAATLTVTPAGGSLGAASIPTLNPAMLMLLALALGGLAFRQNRRKV